ASLEELAAWYRDVVAAAAGAEKALVHADRAEQLLEDGTVERLEGAQRAAELVRDTWRNLEEVQLSATLALEALFIELRRAFAANRARRHWRSERRRFDAYARSLSPVAGEPSAALGVELVAALKRLPRREREPLLLLAWADLTYEQIAFALGLPVGTVRSRISRGRARLRSPDTGSEKPQEAANSV